MHGPVVGHRKEIKMALKPAFTEVKIAKAAFGFYEGHSQEIAC
jgi:hypothetical protein